MRNVEWSEGCTENLASKLEGVVIFCNDSCCSVQDTACHPDPVIQEALSIAEKQYSMLDFYNDFWKPFGELLTDMEKEGFLVNRCVPLQKDPQCSCISIYFQYPFDFGEVLCMVLLYARQTIVTLILLPLSVL